MCGVRAPVEENPYTPPCTCTGPPTNTGSSPPSDSLVRAPSHGRDPVSHTCVSPSARPEPRGGKTGDLRDTPRAVLWLAGLPRRTSRSPQGCRSVCYRQLTPDMSRPDMVAVRTPRHEPTKPPTVLERTVRIPSSCKRPGAKQSTCLAERASLRAEEHTLNGGLLHVKAPR